MKYECPHCNKPDFILHNAFSNVENYGNNTFKIRCLYCDKPVQVTLSRVVTVNYIRKLPEDFDEDELDWR